VIGAPTFKTENVKVYVQMNENQSAL